MFTLRADVVLATAARKIYLRDLVERDPELLDRKAAADNRSLEEHVDAGQRMDAAATAVLALTSRQQDVLCGIYESGLSMLEIARRLGVDSSRVSQVHSQALAALQAAIEAPPKSGRETPITPERQLRPVPRPRTNPLALTYQPPTPTFDLADLLAPDLVSGVAGFDLREVAS